MTRSFSRSGAALALFFSIVLALSVIPVGVLAASPTGDVAFTGVGGTVVVPEGQTTDQISGIAGNVVVRGTVTGDVSALAGDVEITESGEVQGDVSVATGSLRIAGTVGGNVAAGAGNVELAETGSVGGDFSVGTGNLVIAGTIAGNAAVGADQILLQPSAAIAGDLRYDGNLVRQSGSTVEGAIILDENMAGISGPGAWSQRGFGFPPWADTVYGFFANLVLGAVLLLVFPSFSRRVADQVIDRPARSGAIGFLALIGVPILLVFVAITIIGIPIALLGFFVYMLAIWVGLVYGEYAVGHWLLGRGGDEVNRWTALLLGLLIFTVLGFIPIIGGLLVFVALLVGLGALGSAMRGAYRDRRGRRGTPTEATTGTESGSDTSPA